MRKNQEDVGVSTHTDLLLLIKSFKKIKVTEWSYADVLKRHWRAMMNDASSDHIDSTTIVPKVSPPRSDKIKCFSHRMRWWRNHIMLWWTSLERCGSHAYHILRKGYEKTIWSMQHPLIFFNGLSFIDWIVPVLFHLLFLTSQYHWFRIANWYKIEETLTEIIEQFLENIRHLEAKNVELQRCLGMDNSNNDKPSSSGGIANPHDFSNKDYTFR